MPMRTTRPIESRGFCRRFRADTKGATMVEFAAVAGPLVFMLMGVAEIAMIFFGGLILDNATASLAREIRTGQAQKVYDTPGKFRTALCAKAFSLVRCSDSNLLVDVQELPPTGVDLSWPIDENGAFKGEGKFEMGAAKATILVRVFYKHPVLIPMFKAAVSDLPNGERLLVSSVAFRNEPF
jgi:Flp pilus assembly protein TadG